MADIIYIKLSSGVNISKTEVKVKDVADIACSDKELAERINNLRVMNFSPLKNNKEKKSRVVSVIEIIRLIQEENPDIQIENFGSSDVLIKYSSGKTDEKRFLKIMKIVAVCIITFVGSSYAIIAYNNDVGMAEIFSKVYELSGAEAQADSRLIEVCYAVGLFLGIVIFYDHFAGHRISKAPTPIEVAMDQYNEDLDNAIAARVTDGKKET
ncbi:MAG: stage V sporulation protein AA [Lachnospira sp.]